MAPVTCFAGSPAPSLGIMLRRWRKQVASSGGATSQLIIGIVQFFTAWFILGGSSSLKAKLYIVRMLFF